eukprot:879082-Pleurochrysis_carterae.AAC.2
MTAYPAQLACTIDVTRNATGTVRVSLHVVFKARHSHLMLCSNHGSLTSRRFQFRNTALSLDVVPLQVQLAQLRLACDGLGDGGGAGVANRVGANRERAKRRAAEQRLRAKGREGEREW